MLRSTRIAIALAAICAVVIAMAGSAVAAAPAPNGSLTASEYKQLTAQLVALKKFDHNKRATWQEGYAACDKVGQSTALLHSIRTNCNTVLGLDQALTGFYTQVARCSAFSTTTTGTTTTTTPTQTTTTETTTTGTTTTGTTPRGTTTTTGGLSNAELQFIACLEPEYQVISRAAKSVYDVQVALRGQVLARRFGGRCLLTLAPRRSDLELLHRFAATSKQLAADVAKLSKVFAGTLPAGAVNTSQINKDAKAFNNAGDAIGKTSRPQKLSVCPHATR
jgi:hypothetical protein